MKFDFVQFPDLSLANSDGLLASGGDLELATLVSAYSQGIFPWFNHGQPILWWSPNPRLVIYPNRMHISKSLGKTIKKKNFELRANSDFAAVIEACAARNKALISDQENTWITPEMQAAYIELHNAGYAHSIETWLDGQLVGGLYGIALGRVFFGESMFSFVNDASKVAFFWLCQWLLNKGFRVIDCQICNDHLLSLGAQEIPRNQFVDYLSDIDINTPSKNFASGFDEFATTHIPVIKK